MGTNKEDENGPLFPDGNSADENAEGLFADTPEKSDNPSEQSEETEAAGNDEISDSDKDKNDDAKEQEIAAEENDGSDKSDNETDLANSVQEEAAPEDAVPVGTVNDETADEPRNAETDGKIYKEKPIPVAVLVLLIAVFAVCLYAGLYTVSVMPDFVTLQKAESLESKHSYISASDKYGLLISNGYTKKVAEKYIEINFKTGNINTVSNLINELYGSSKPKYGKAKKLYEQNEKITSTSEILTSIAQNSSTNADMNTLFSEFDKKLNKNYDNAVIYYIEYTLALQYSQGQEKCYTYICKAINANPDYYWLLSQKAFVENSMNKPDDALKTCQKAFSLNSEDYIAYSEQAKAYLLKGEKDKATKAAEKSCKINKYDTNLNILALCYLAEGNTSKYNETVKFMEDNQVEVASFLTQYQQGKATIADIIVAKEASK